MSLTFTNTLPAAVWNGEQVELSFNLAIPGNINDSFTQLAICVNDLSTPGHNPLSYSIKRIDLTNELAKFEVPHQFTKYTFKFYPAFEDKLSSKISISSLERVAGAGDQDFFTRTLVIDVTPDAPKLSLTKPMTFKLSAANGINLVGGEIVVNGPINAGVIKLSFTVVGTSPDGSGFSVDLQEQDYVPNAELGFKTINLNNFYDGAFKADTSMFIYARVLSDKFISSASENVTGVASIRLLPPKILSSNSAEEEKKINLDVSVFEAPYLAVPTVVGEVIRYSIVAVRALKDQVVDAKLIWKVTNIKDQSAPVKPNALANQEYKTMNHEVTQVDGVALVLATAYRFAAVSHYGPLDVTKSFDIKAVTSPPPLSQSELSNMDVTGLAIEYIDDTVGWDCVEQTTAPNVAINNTLYTILTFAPKFVGVLPSGVLPSSNQTLLCSYTFSKKSGDVETLLNSRTVQSSVLTVPPAPFFNVNNPVKDDMYILTATIEVFVNNEDAELTGSSIFAIPVVPGSSSRIKVITLKKFSNTVRQSIASEDIPSLKDHSLSVETFGENTGAESRILVSSHKTPSANEFKAVGCELIGVEHQLIKGVSSTDPLEFHPNNLLQFADGATLKTTTTPHLNQHSSSSNKDVPEVIPHQLNGTAVPQPKEVYSMRVRPVIKDLKSGNTVYGQYSYAHHHVAEALMNAPINVTINPFHNGKNDSLRVSFTVAKQRDLKNQPADWANSNTLPESYSVDITNADGNVIGSIKNKKFTDLELYGYDIPANLELSIANNTGTTTIPMSSVVSGMELLANDSLRAFVTIKYLRKGTNSMKYGSPNIPTGVYLVNPPIEVKSIKVEQDPPSKLRGGSKAVDANFNGSRTITVTAEVNLNGLLPTILGGCKVECWAGGLEAVMEYDSVKKVFTAKFGGSGINAIALNAATDYQIATYIVVARHAYSQNGQSILILQ